MSRILGTDFSSQFPRSFLTFSVNGISKQPMLISFRKVLFVLEAFAAMKVQSSFSIS